MLVTGGLGKSAGALVLRGLGAFPGAAPPAPEIPQAVGGGLRRIGKRRPDFIDVLPTVIVRKVVSIGPRPTAQALLEVLAPIRLQAVSVSPAPSSSIVVAEVVDEIALLALML